MLWAFMYMRFVHLTPHSRSRLRSRTHILANVIETNKRSLPNSRLSFFIVLVLSARLAILTDTYKMIKTEAFYVIKYVYIFAQIVPYSLCIKTQKLNC